MSQPFIAEIRLFGFNFPPRGWATCDGQLLSIQQNAALFSLLGTTYGGNGIQTFALPDLRGRVPIHWGQGPGLSNVSLGEVAGVESVTLISTEIPAHNHPMQGVVAPAANQRSASGNMPGAPTFNLYATGSPVAMDATAVTTAGGNQPHSNLQPYTVVNASIALQGIFPSRN